MRKIYSYESSVGIVFMLTFVVFLILKLTGVINWSWWLITAPLWIPCALTFSLCFAFMVFWFIFFMICILFDIFEDIF